MCVYVCTTVNSYSFSVLSAHGTFAVSCLQLLESRRINKGEEKREIERGTRMEIGKSKGLMTNHLLDQLHAVNVRANSEREDTPASSPTTFFPAHRSYLYFL